MATKKHSSKRTDTRATSGQPLAKRLDTLVATAVADYCRGKNHRSAVFNGVIRRAHRWCVDFLGYRNELIDANIAKPEWLDDDVECKEVKLAGRRIEIFRPAGFREFEVSIRYSDADREALYKAEPRGTA